MTKKEKSNNKNRQYMVASMARKKSKNLNLIVQTIHSKALKYIKMRDILRTKNPIKLIMMKFN
jgi:hypothetical protein